MRIVEKPAATRSSWRTTASIRERYFPRRPRDLSPIERGRLTPPSDSSSGSIDRAGRSTRWSTRTPPRSGRRCRTMGGGSPCSDGWTGTWTSGSTTSAAGRGTAPRSMPGTTSTRCGRPTIPASSSPGFAAPAACTCIANCSAHRRTSKNRCCRSLLTASLPASGQWTCPRTGDSCSTPI